MSPQGSRREFLKTTVAAAGGLALASGPDEIAAASDAPSVRVVVWDERQPAQKEAYPNFLGNRIAEHLRTQPGLDVASVALDDPEQGLSAKVLDGCRILIWWGHVRNGEVAPETGRKIVERIKAGTLSLIALHSAHWSTPFVEAMNERARIDLTRHNLAGDSRLEATEVPPPQRYTVPKYDTRVTPYVDLRKYPDGRVAAKLHLPYCCFPSYRNDGQPSRVRALKPDHLVLHGVPHEFTLARTEMYDEPFHVPEPDEVLLEERWGPGEWFRSGMVWKVGEGRVFYFRPGHETYPIYDDPNALRIVTNAVRWLGSERRA